MTFHSISTEQGFASQKEVYLPKHRKVITAILFPFAGLCISAPWLFAGQNRGDFLFCVLFFETVAIGCGLIIWNLWVSRLTFTVDCIEKRNLFGVKTLRFEEITGFRASQGKNTMLILVGNGTKNSIWIDGGYANYANIIAWAHDHLTNLDAADALQIKHQILNDSSLGGTAETRAARLVLLKKVMKWMTFLVMGISIWGLVWPQPYRLVIAALVLAFLLPVALLRIFRGYIVLDALQSDPRPKAAIFLFPLLTLGFRAIMDLTPLGHVGSIVLLCLGGGILLMMLLPWERGVLPKPVFYILMVPLLGFFCYGPLMEADVLLDSSPYRVDSVQVLEKSLSHNSKGGAYYQVTVSGWGEFPKRTFQVGRKFYDSIQYGERLKVVTHRGFFDIPWGQLKRPRVFLQTSGATSTP